MDPRATAELGTTGVKVTRLGLGSAPLGNLEVPHPDEQAEQTVARAYELGIRFFDTAPLYGAGLAEQRVGRALAQVPRDSYTLATKVGRLLRGDGSGRLQPIFDFTADGIRISFEESLGRLGLDRVDVLHIHDPDNDYEQALTESYPVLAGLRSEGTIRAVGAGMNQSAMEARFLRAAAFDCFLLAGRYSLLDQSGLADLLPLAAERGASVISGGVFNSGLLADPDSPDATYDYHAAPPELVARARRLAAICRNHGVDLRAAAMQFPLAHPAVATIVIGARSAEEVETDVALFETEIPAQLWAELRVEGALPEHAPVPA